MRVHVRLETVWASVSFLSKLKKRAVPVDKLNMVCNVVG